MGVLKYNEFGDPLVGPSKFFRDGLAELFDDKDDETSHEDQEYDVLGRGRAGFIFVKILNEGN